MSSLALAGVVAIGSLVYTLVVLLVETPFYYPVYKDKPLAAPEPFILDWNIFQSCALVFFAYTCQMNLFPIYSELVKPDQRRINKVIYRSLLVDFVFYVLIGGAGYLSTLNYTSDVVIIREPLPGFDPDYCVIISAVAICLVLITSVPTNYNPGRQ